jgi:hypothetical protein
MSELTNVLTPNQPTDRERAIIAAGSLIDCLTELPPNVQEIKDRLYQLGKHCRAVIAEIRQAEAKASGQLAHTSINEYLGI